MEVKEILQRANAKELRELFGFSSVNSDNEVLAKFQLWSRYFFPRYFSSPDATFHPEIDGNNLAVYRGTIDSFTDIAFRGAAKTARTKLFVGFVIANDKDHFRRYFKVLNDDPVNSAQIVTDVYNMLTNKRVAALYPEIFEKTNGKREERMSSFTTATGVKVIADTVGTAQRGALQEDARPDFIWIDDFETRKTLRSARTTKAIWDNMEEARTGLAKGGGCVYTCNYISEQGNVHRLVLRKNGRHIVLIIPIKGTIVGGVWKDGPSNWERYTLTDIAQMKEDDDDFEGERLCKPSASKDILFDRETLDAMERRDPVRTVADFKMFFPYDPSHRYASGHDVSGGVGLDSSTSVFIDFSTVPAQVVATFASNTIKPDTFGDEIQREGDYFGSPLSAPEKNNYGHATIARARQLGVKLFTTKPKDTKVDQKEPPKEYGWHTNTLTKPKMLFDFGKAVADGLLRLNDEALIAEAAGFTRNDLMDDEEDARLTTRHFDLLIAAAIAWQMKDYATVAKTVEDETPYEEPEPLYSDIGI